MSEEAKNKKINIESESKPAEEVEKKVVEEAEDLEVAKNVVDKPIEEKPVEEKVTTKKLTDKDKLFRVGDLVEVGYKIIEGGNERVQPYSGIVIAKKGSSIARTFTVRRIGAKNIGVERIFPLHSPKISYIKVLKPGKVRRSKLYYLRQNRSKKDSKIKERIVVTAKKTD